MGSIGLEPSVFYMMSYYEYDCASHGHRKQKQREQELQRMMIWQVHNVNSKKGHQKQSPADMFTLDLIDVEPKSIYRNGTKEEFLQVIDMFNNKEKTKYRLPEWLT